MTQGAVKAKTIAGCPLPPDGLREAALPIVEFDLSVTRLYRIHRRIYDPIFYNRRSNSTRIYRFDSPDDSFGVLYASPSFDVCMAETIMRDRYLGVNASEPRYVDERDLAERSIATLGFGAARSLRLADLTGPLWQFGFDAQVLSVSDYTAPNQWSAAIHDNIGNLDGIYFRSRYLSAASVAVFGDRAQLVQKGASVPLHLHPETPGFLERFQIGIADPGGEAWMAPEQ
ncbi:RES domain-containing protein [Paraburkholderia phenazinium]|uniref:RES domain-containing protein n=1 Tax=Paraburkholderia phenazinium TaxID=60549 RepID=A0A1G7NVX1_9BURK|nr:RES domain-containing protein [Paraburkholderia phenazinium]